MKKIFVCIALITTTFSFAQLGDYYYSNNHPKAKGLNFQIKKPLGYEQSEGDRPNIVQKWIKNKTDNSKMVSFMINVRNDEVFKQYSIEFWEEYLKSKEGVEDFLSGMMDNVSSYRYIVIDGYPGLIVDYETESRRLAFSFKLYSNSIYVIVDSHLLTLTLSSPNLKLKDENMLLLYKLANSIIFPEQYK